MKITIRTLDQNTTEINVPEEGTVPDLKVLLAKSKNIPADSQRLIYNGKELDDHQLLREYGNAVYEILTQLEDKIINGCTVHLVEKPKKQEPDIAVKNETSDADRILQTDNIPEENSPQISNQSLDHANINEIQDLRERAKSVQNHFSAAINLLDSQYPTPMISENVNNNIVREPLKIFNQVVKLSNSYSKLLVTHSNSYLEMTAAAPDGHSKSTSTDIRNCASLLRKSMHHASLAFKEMSEIKLEATDVDESKVPFTNSNQMNKHLSANLSGNNSMDYTDVPLASIVQETFIKGQMQNSSGSSVNTAKGVKKLADDGKIDYTSNDKEQLNSFSPANINEHSVRTQNLVDDSIHRKERLRLRKLQYVEQIDDNWRTKVPMDTHETIAHDLIVQQFTSIQPPYSDAYLSLLPSEIKDEALSQTSNNV